jgi:hypothetical protein
MDIKAAAKYTVSIFKAEDTLVKGKGKTIPLHAMEALGRGGEEV